MKKEFPAVFFYFKYHVLEKMYFQHCYLKKKKILYYCILNVAMSTHTSKKVTSSHTRDYLEVFFL